MKIFINFYSSLLPSAAGQVDKESKSVCVKDGTTLFELAKELKVSSGEAVLFIVNGATVAKDRVLLEGDRVGIIPVVSGG